MRGLIRLPLGRDKWFTVWGGRYVERPSSLIGVKMAMEINEPCDIDIPTKDYCTPSKKDMQRGLEDAVERILGGQGLYVGCMGGVGRTGLFLALLAKAFGIDDPILYTRVQYYRDAVETKAQMKYIQEFRIPLSVRWAIFKSRIRLVSRSGSLTDYLTKRTGEV